MRHSSLHNYETNKLNFIRPYPAVGAKTGNYFSTNALIAMEDPEISRTIDFYYTYVPAIKAFFEFSGKKVKSRWSELEPEIIAHEA